MLRSTSIAVVSIFLLFKRSAAINACPVTDTVFTGTQGIRYRICPGTDLIGDSQVITPNVASTTACAQLCDEALNCFKAVFDTQTKECHIKAHAGLNWQPNGRFDVIQAEQINIAKCPYTETAYTNNGVSISAQSEDPRLTTVVQKSFKICRDTDLRGGSAQIINNVMTLNDCAQRCSTIDACVQAVFESTASVCHIKVDATTNTLIWSTDKRFDVIRRDVTVAPATNGAWSDLVRFPVIPVAAYIVPEFPSSSRLMVFSSWGADAFGGASGRTQFADYNFNS